MKKITLLCITAITCLSLSACGKQATKKSDSSSKSSSSKVVKKHKKSNKQYKSVNSSSSSSQQTQVQSSATPVKQANQSNAQNSYQASNHLIIKYLKIMHLLVKIKHEQCLAVQMVICKLPEPAMVGLFLAMVTQLPLMMMEPFHTINLNRSISTGLKSTSNEHMYERRNNYVGRRN